MLVTEMHTHVCVSVQRTREPRVCAHLHAAHATDVTLCVCTCEPVCARPRVAAGACGCTPTCAHSHVYLIVCVLCESCLCGGQPLPVTGFDANC